ncbi:MAG: cytochrome c peroxidase [Nitrosomonas halophila]
MSKLYWVLIGLILPVLQTSASEIDPPRPLSLKTVQIPEPPDLHQYIRDKPMAIALGKALFWDMQVGSDNIVACATCHFHAGADSRSKNQVNPGTHALSDAQRREFDLGPNMQLTASHFPLRVLTDPDDRASPAVFSSDDVISSQGIASYEFLRVLPSRPVEQLRRQTDQDGFSVNRINVRRVEPRNTPTVINAIFNYRNFYDGRAQYEFNGVNNWGDRDPNAHLYRAESATRVEPVRISIEQASLASQAVAAAVNDFELSASDRPFPMIGRKMLVARPLAQQQVHPQDSVLRKYSRWPQPGLALPDYAEMVRHAFQPEWWQSDQQIRLLPGGHSEICHRARPIAQQGCYTLMEFNFSLFFGLAIQLYEATLVADDTPYDRFMEGDSTAISEAAIRGVDIFRSQTRGRCINCHEGAELTGAAVSQVQASPVRIREGQAFDRGYNNIGVRPATSDLALGQTDPFGTPLSYTKQLYAAPVCPDGHSCPVVADGFFKVPGLRNVELTAPYFHNGGELTLRGVLDVYSRGGNFAQLTERDGSSIMLLNILHLSEQEKLDLEAWLLSLTDERVRYRRAPFDHPQIFVPNGHPGDTEKIDKQVAGTAADHMVEMPAVGEEGAYPMPGFLESDM